MQTELDMAGDTFRAFQHFYTPQHAFVKSPKVHRTRNSACNLSTGGWYVPGSAAGPRQPPIRLHPRPAASGFWTATPSREEDAGLLDVEHAADRVPRVDACDHLREQLAHGQLAHLARRLEHVGRHRQRVGHHHLQRRRGVTRLPRGCRGGAARVPRGRHGGAVRAQNGPKSGCRAGAVRARCGRKSGRGAGA